MARKKAGGRAKAKPGGRSKKTKAVGGGKARKSAKKRAAKKRSAQGGGAGSKRAAKKRGSRGAGRRSREEVTEDGWSTSTRSSRSGGSKPGAKKRATKKQGSKRAAKKRGSGSRRDLTEELESIADQEDRLVRRRRQRGGKPLQLDAPEASYDLADDDDDASVLPLPWERGGGEYAEDEDEGEAPRSRAGGRGKKAAKKTVKKAAGKKVAKKVYPKLAEAGLDRLLDKLDRARQPLFREWRNAIRAIREDIGVDDEPHVFCTRKYNQMRITDLEALSIARAFHDEEHLKRRLNDVKERIAEEVRHLKKGRRRQNFTCPLLEGDKCLVHQTAKPIGCLAWQPNGQPSEAGWRAFNQRNHYNERMVNLDWDIAAIPIMLEKYIDGEKLEPGAVRVSEQRRGKSREKASESRAEGKGRRGVARLSERDQERERWRKSAERRKTTSRKKKSAKKTSRKKSSRKKSGRRRSR